MKLIPVFLGLITILLIASSSKNAENSIKGSLQVVRAQYGDGQMSDVTDLTAIKTITDKRWSVAYFNKDTKVFDGAGGGTYTLKGDEYLETVEYFSWDTGAVGQTAKFTLTIENGMLHQKGVVKYKGNPNYVIDEWSKKID